MFFDNLQEGAAGYGVGWFSLALINAGLAQGKARSGLAWWLVSLFIGPVATFLIVVLPRGDVADVGRETPRWVLIGIGVVLIIAVVLGLFSLAASG